MIYVANSVGNNKIESEDTILVGDSLISGSCKTLPIPSEGFICVADGVGGNNGGKEASTYVLDELSSLSAKSDDIASAIADINARLIDLSVNNPDLFGMATTLTGIHIKSKGIELIHIGNSRAISCRGGI
jgi:protein phosphatase